MWSERITETFTLPYQKVERIGKCFLILMTEQKETLCYYKFSATDFKIPKPEWKYYEMLPDPCVNKV